MSTLFRDRAFGLPLAVLVSGLVFIAALLYRPVPATDPLVASQGYSAAAGPAAPAGAGVFVGLVGGLLGLIFAAILLFFTLLFAVEVSIKIAGWIGDRTPLGRLGLAQAVQFVLLMFKSIRRNPLRTSLAYLATFVMVLVITLVWSVLSFLDAVQKDKARNFKVIITEKYQIPSQMPPSYGPRVRDTAMTLPPGLRPGPKDYMSWSFVLATLDPAKMSFQNSLFFFCMDPNDLIDDDPASPTYGSSMMDGLSRDELGNAGWKLVVKYKRAMEQNIKAVVLGEERAILLLGKDRTERIKAGEPQRFKATGINYKDIEFEFDVIGIFPKGEDGRYDQSAVMNSNYLLAMLDAYKADPNKGNGTAHPLADKCLNLIWLRLPTKEAFERLAALVNDPGRFASPSVKVENASSAIGNFLDAYKDIIWGMRWMLGPAILAVMSLVIANAISISVRERRPEMAVLKVLGFRPWMVMALVLGEAVLIGAVGGGLSTTITWFGVNKLMGGFKFPIAFFPSFKIADAALWWGPAIGFGTALLGSFLPAWSARRVKVSEVFSKIT